jgi:signal transduction histidine kinase/ActR/RegA family two-component response regulator
VTRQALGGEARQVAWATIPGTGWRLLVVAPEARIYAQASALGETYRRVGWSLLLGLGIFYAIFLGVLYRRTRAHSRRLSEPLGRIGQMVAEIEAGRYVQEAPRFAIDELDATAARIAQMGRRLGENNNDLIVLRDRALESSRLKSAFMASMSHELRTPMHNILGASELLLEAPLPQDERALAQTVHDAGGAMLRLIDDLLDLSRIEAGHLSLSLAPYSPRRWLAPILEMFQPKARRKGLSLTAEVDPALPTQVVGDAGRLRQILVNLLSNALKFTDAGAVEVWLHEARRDEALVWVRIEVRDTGIGIAPEAHGRLFEPFTQVDGSHSRQHEGVGLGLSICRQLAEAMGGQIGVQSQPGRGSTFWVEIPLALTSAPAQDEGPDEARDEPPAALAARILIVDDNPLNLNMLQRVLRKQSYEVERASAGPEALALLARTRVDLILTDVHMPGMDGVELAGKIRALLGEQAPPIIAVTADAWQESRARFLAQGMDDCITKPYQLDQLRALVQAWLTRLPERRQEPPQG